MAETVGFEPTDGCPSTDFETGILFCLAGVPFAVARH